MEVYYYNRSRKQNIENSGVQYLPLNELLSTCEIISTHLPKNTIILDGECFDVLGNGKILINTSLGLTFEKANFLTWVKNQGNYAIFDADGVGKHHEDFEKHKQIIISAKVGGWTSEAIDRLSSKVIENVKSFVEDAHNSQP